MTPIDRKINLGYHKQIAEAMAYYMKIPESVIEVHNDRMDPSLTYIRMHPVNTSKPRLRLGLQELERFRGAMIKTSGSGENGEVSLRIRDSVICDFTKEQLERRAAKEGIPVPEFKPKRPPMSGSDEPEE